MVTSLGFKDVVDLHMMIRIEELSNLHLDGDTYTYDVIDKPIKETLAELKEKKYMLKFLSRRKITKQIGTLFVKLIVEKLHHNLLKMKEQT